MSTETQLRTAMQAYLDGLNHRDPEAVLALFAEGGTIEDPVGSQVSGDARTLLPQIVGSLPEGTTFTLDTPIRTSHGRGAAMAFTVRTQLDGRPVEIRSVDVMQFTEDGLITEMKAYYGPSDIISDGELFKPAHLD